MKILILAALAIAAPAIAQDAASAERPVVSGNTTPTGGYGPTTPSAPIPAGATVVYRQAPTPEQAFPAPAPRAKYPVCKKDQFDGCVQRHSPK